MAKKGRTIKHVALKSTAGTGFQYHTRKNLKKYEGKIELRKYDPVIRKHVAFKES